VTVAAEGAGIVEKGEWDGTSIAWQKAWSSICGVWASKWNDRAWFSRNARGIKDGDLKMAVLLQQVEFPLPLLVAFRSKSFPC
jgi:phosphoenolpyruvate synthase/pyruvate phosphate dikinase